MIKKKKMGRPLIPIDKIQFEKLCGMFCTLQEIAGFFNCCEDTIENWTKKEYGLTFSDIYKRLSSVGKISLRRQQMKVAMKGNTSMLIFLGKQYLNQKDNPENDELQESLNKLDSYLNNLPK